jgi:hypothetical protein
MKESERTQDSMVPTNVEDKLEIKMESQGIHTNKGTAIQ